MNNANNTAARSRLETFLGYAAEWQAAYAASGAAGLLAAYTATRSVDLRAVGSEYDHLFSTIVSVVHPMNPVCHAEATERLPGMVASLPAQMKLWYGRR